MKVKVLPIDIKLGRRSDCSKCPIARAVMRAVRGKAKRVSVDTDGIAVRIGNRYQTYITPERAANFINDFDEKIANSHWVRPFEFNVEINESVYVRPR